MKHVLALLLALTLVCTLLAGCGTKKIETDPATQTGTQSESGEKTVKIGLIVGTGGLGDQNFNDLAYNGLLEAQKLYGIEFDYSEPQSASDYASYITQYAEDGSYDLIIDTSFVPGDLMLIEDHINLLGYNPLIGPNEDAFGVRFPDMTEAYSKEMRKCIGQAADELGIALKRGVYCAFTGPSYETPAEIRMLRAMGASAVGMSTVPEVIVANHCGLQVAAVSCISNMAAGILDQPLTSEEVLETADIVKEKFIGLLSAAVKLL